MQKNKNNFISLTHELKMFVIFVINDRIILDLVLENILEISFYKQGAKMRTFFWNLMLSFLMLLFATVISFVLAFAIDKALIFIGNEAPNFWFLFIGMCIWLSAGIPKHLVRDGSTDVARKIAGYITYFFIVVGAALLVSSINLYTVVQWMFASILIIVSFAQHEPMQLIRKRKE